jgi:NADPH:quinone reductase-like Zn-dependent oxidoreductase
VETSEVNELLTLLKPGGMLVSGTMPADGSEAERLGVRTLRMSTQPSAQQLTRIASLVDDGLVKPCIAERFSLRDVGEAFKMLGKTHGGKILLVVNDQL